MKIVIPDIVIASEHLNPAHDESKLHIAERLAEILDHRPRRMPCLGLNVVLAGLTKFVVTAIACVVASVVIWAAALKLVADIDWRDVVSKRLAASAQITDPTVKHDRATTLEMYTARQSRKHFDSSRD